MAFTGLFNESVDGVSKQTLIPGEKTGTLRDGYGQGAFVGIKGVKQVVGSIQ